MSWNLIQAAELCHLLETVAPTFGAHVALTGGTLYKFGERKDVDILFYRIRQVPRIKTFELLRAMVDMGFVIGRDTGWCIKATYEGRPVDLFFPERPADEIGPNIVDEYGLARVLS